MLTSGDVVFLDLGEPVGREAGHPHPAVVITAQRLLDASPSVVHVVPLTSTMRGFGSEVVIEADQQTGLDRASSAQCQHIRAVAAVRLADPVGNVGGAPLAQIRAVLGLILDIPG